MRKRVFVVCGGPSLESESLGWLRKEDTIAVNHMARYLPEPTYFLTADSGVICKAVKNKFWELSERTKTVVVINSKEHPNWKKVQHCIYKFDEYIVPTRWDGRISLDDSEFATGKNTGLCALQYAVRLGYKEIYLLGVDLQMDGNRKYCYDNEARNSSPYGVFLQHFTTGCKILLRANIKVYSCSSVSPLNRILPYKKLVDIVPRMPVFVSHYTKNTPYEEVMATHLVPSLKKHDLDYHIEGIVTLGSWRRNSNWCALQVRDCLDRFAPRPILRLDADAKVQQYPELFIQKDFQADFAACIWKKSKLRPTPDGELMGGTLYFASNDRIRLFVDKWVEKIKKRSKHRNPDLLYEVLKKDKGVRFFNLPLEYCKVFDFLMAKEEKEPVIEHFQASRKYKHIVNRLR